MKRDWGRGKADKDVRCGASRLPWRSMNHRLSDGRSSGDAISVHCSLLDSVSRAAEYLQDLDGSV
jgi:hypothetical protein